MCDTLLVYFDTFVMFFKIGMTRHGGGFGFDSGSGVGPSDVELHEFITSQIFHCQHALGGRYGVCFLN